MTMIVIVLIVIMDAGRLVRRIVRRVGGHGVLMPGLWFRATQNRVGRRLSVEQRADRWDRFVRLKLWSRWQRLARSVFVIGGLIRCRTCRLSGVGNIRCGNRTESRAWFDCGNRWSRVRPQMGCGLGGIRLSARPRVFFRGRCGWLGSVRWFLRSDVGCWSGSRLERRRGC